MTKQLLENTFDPNTLAAIEFLAGEDTNAILATWFRMLALASRDPEGCVRLTPGLQMDTEALAGYFHCTGEAVEATIQVMEQLQLLNRTEDGTLRLSACTGTGRRSKTKKSSDPILLSGEKETEKEKRKEAKEKSKEKNKKGDIAAAISESPARAGAAEDIRPFKAKNRLIPLTELPEPARNILKAWNKLPLDNKFEGLYPTLLKQMQAMLERYGEETLLKAVANVADSSFLLGSSRNSRGWSISLGWMLKPDHLENILQGKYLDKKSRNDSPLFQPEDGQAPYSNGFYGTVVN